jgi:glycosyltransferase involved in cell wall biosynthesis
VKRAQRTILISGNSSWYLWNFRRNVVGALSDRGMEVVAVSPKDNYSRRLAALPRTRWIDWPLSLNDANPVEELWSLLRFVGIVRLIRPDFVINHGMKANIYGGLACRLLSVPYANSVTGLGMKLAKSGLRPRALARLYAFACNHAHSLFIQNYDDLAVLRSAALSPDVATVRTMGSGVDLAHFAFEPMPRGDVRTFLFVGRLQEDKGIWDFVEAARIIRTEFPDTRFVAAGSQTFANRGAVSDEVLNDWNREGVVQLVGDQEDVRPWLARAHALVLPSHGGEGVPRAILEAAAMGRPSIATDVPGCRDAVVGDSTGYLVPKHDIPALVDAMLRICKASDDELAAMGQAARSDAEARFSDAQLIEAVIAAVEAAR